MEFLDMATLQEEGLKPIKWLVRGWWPGGDYGVIAGEPKAQKSWAALDMAVSVASGTPWLGIVPVDDPGPVLIFYGEGGKPVLYRRLRALCEERQLDLTHLPIIAVPRAPHLSNLEDLDEMEAQIQEMQPRLVVIDPLYLAAKGANTASVTEMGGLLEVVQLMCQDVGSSLVIVAHFNRNKDASGAARISGAGPWEWARVIITATIKRKESEDHKTVVTTRLDALLGNGADRDVTVKRSVWSDDAHDLNALLNVRTEREGDVSTGDRVLDMLVTPRTARAVRQALSEPRPSLDAVRKTLERARAQGLVRSDKHGREVLWSLV